jgi:hypothetical protein
LPVILCCGGGVCTWVSFTNIKCSWIMFNFGALKY